MWGIFFEDINFGADGGLYAEMVKNRGFEFPDPLMGWTKISPSLAKGDLSIRDDDGYDAGNPHYARIHSEGTAHFGISNEGFRRHGECMMAKPTIFPSKSGSWRAPRASASISSAAMAPCLPSPCLSNFPAAWTRGRG